jgi:hypothetical protein
MAEHSLTCAACGEPVSPSWNVCSACGRELDKASIARPSAALIKAGDGSVIKAQISQSTNLAAPSPDAQGGATLAGQPMVAFGSDSVGKVEIQQNFYGVAPGGLSHRPGPNHIRVSDRFSRRHDLNLATLMFEDGRRTLLLAKKEVKLGRQKKVNDLVLRFLPPSEEFNELSLRISQEQAVLSLTEKGLSIKNLGRFGTAVNRTSTELIVLSAEDHADEAVDVQLGSDPIQVEEPLHLAFHFFRWDQHFSDQNTTGYGDSPYFDAVGAARSSTYGVAQEAGVDAIRVRRRNNLPEEEYVLLFRQALIGSSHRCPIEVPGLANARILHIGRCFWLENLGEPSTIRVEEQPLPPRELVALAPGMPLRFGMTPVRFEEFAQLHL